MNTPSNNTCDKCAHHKPSQYATSKTYGYCTKQLEARDEMDLEQLDFPADGFGVAEVQQHFDPQVMVGPKFGCIHWEPKPVLPNTCDACSHYKPDYDGATFGFCEQANRESKDAEGRPNGFNGHSNEGGVDRTELVQVDQKFGCVLWLKKEV